MDERRTSEPAGTEGQKGSSHLLRTRRQEEAAGVEQPAGGAASGNIREQVEG